MNKKFEVKLQVLPILVYFSLCRIMKLQNLRQVDSLKEKWWKHNPHTPTDCEYNPEKVTGEDIWHIGGVFLIMPVGKYTSIQSSPLSLLHRISMFDLRNCFASTLMP